MAIPSRSATVDRGDYPGGDGRGPRRDAYASASSRASPRRAPPPAPAHTWPLARWPASLRVSERSRLTSVTTLTIMSVTEPLFVSKRRLRGDARGPARAARAAGRGHRLHLRDLRVRDLLHVGELVLVLRLRGAAVGARAPVARARARRRRRGPRASLLDDWKAASFSARTLPMTASASRFASFMRSPRAARGGRWKGSPPGRARARSDAPARASATIWDARFSADISSEIP